MGDIDQNQKDHNGETRWEFVVKWILANSIGSTMGMVLLIFVGLLLGAFGSSLPPDESGPVLPPTLGEIAAASVIGAPTGLTIGIAQWLVLRRRISKAGWWIAASTIGFATAFVLIMAAPPAMKRAIPSHLLFYVPWAALGAVSGVLQWLVLQRQLSRSIWWIPASTLASIVGGELWTSAGPGGGILGWAVAGVITGVVLDWLFRHSVSQA